MRRPSAGSSAIGFSTSTALPAAAARSVSPQWLSVWVAM